MVIKGDDVNKFKVGDTELLMPVVEALEFYAKGFTAHERIKDEAHPPGHQAREALTSLREKLK
jgi:hypothetical protein